MRTITRANAGVASSPCKWLVTTPSRTPVTMRLFCFSHAGGNASSYRDWQSSLPSGVQVCAIQLPGRGSRMFEPAIDNMRAIVLQVTQALIPYLDKPFAFFGHSMGAVVAFEVCRELRRRGLTLPMHLFVSACRAPHLPLGRRPLHQLPQAEFLDALKDLNGTPAEALANRELMELLEPVLRADFRAIETRQYLPEQPLSLPITAFGGDQDPGVSAELLSAWRAQTTAGFWSRQFPGDHFYLVQQKDSLLRQISDLLCMAPRMAM